MTKLPFAGSLMMLMLIVFSQSPLALAQSKDAAKKTDTFAEQRGEVKKVTAKLDGQRLELLPGPLYTYEEVIHKWHDGTSWVWGEKGRPAIFLNMMTLRTTRYYEFISLTSGRPRVDIGYGSSWTPKNSWKPKEIMKAPTPAKNRNTRLIQMRSIARRFDGKQFQGDNVQRLRRLPQPIYRYAEESDESLDGAIFAFLREGDLEIILVIDGAKQKDGSSSWTFDCMPVSIDKQEMLLDGKVVWERKSSSFAKAGEQNAAYHIFSRRARNAEQANVN